MLIMTVSGLMSLDKKAVHHLRVQTNGISQQSVAFERIQDPTGKLNTLHGKDGLKAANKKSEHNIGSDRRIENLEISKVNTHRQLNLINPLDENRLKDIAKILKRLA